jgi:hypothetical protein
MAISATVEVTGRDGTTEIKLLETIRDGDPMTRTELVVNICKAMNCPLFGSCETSFKRGEIGIQVGVDESTWRNKGLCAENQGYIEFRRTPKAHQQTRRGPVDISSAVAILRSIRAGEQNA